MRFWVTILFHSIDMKFLIGPDSVKILKIKFTFRRQRSTIVRVTDFETVTIYRIFFLVY
jgi:hypothetical protein